MIFEQNCENTNTPKSKKQEQRWISCLKEPTFCKKSQLVKLPKKFRKIQMFETNLDLNKWKLATFSDKGGTINPRTTLPPLVHVDSSKDNCC